MFLSIISKDNDEASIVTTAIKLKRLRVYFDHVSTINLNTLSSCWLKFLKPSDVKILTKTKTCEYIFKHSTNRTNNIENNSLVEIEKEILIDGIIQLIKISEPATKSEMLL